MCNNRTLLIALAVVSAVLMLLLSFLVNLASTYIADALKPYAVWIFAALGIVFVASLGVLIWQVYADREGTSDRNATGGPQIEQAATNGGQIVDSPNRIAGQAQASVRQTANDQGRIENSANTIE